MVWVEKLKFDVCFLLPIVSEGGGMSVNRLNPWFKLKNWHWPHDYTNYTDYTAKITLLLTTVNYRDHTDYIYYTNFTDYIHFIYCTDYCTAPTTMAKIIINFGSPIQFSNTMRLIKLLLLIWLITPTTASTLNYTNSTDCIGAALTLFTYSSKMETHDSGFLWWNMICFLHQLKSNCGLGTDYKTRRANGIPSKWSNKTKNLSYCSNFHWNVWSRESKFSAIEWPGNSSYLSSS